MYKTLGVKWLLETFCPTSTFVTADRDEARNPQRFIHVTVTCKAKKTEMIRIKCLPKEKIEKPMHVAHICKRVQFLPTLKRLLT
jgi:hypothetical protein